MTSKRNVDKYGPDFYSTPAWATRALCSREFLDGVTWECSCGDGSMSKVIKAENKLPNTSLISSDRNDFGYGETGVDFLASDIFERFCEIDNIVTNPPFNLAEEFVLQALNIANRKVCLLLRLSFLESVCRYNRIFHKLQPSRVWIFSERLTMYPKGEERAVGGTTAYAWFVWDKDANIGFKKTQLHWIKPGSKKQ